MTAGPGVRAPGSCRAGMRAPRGGVRFPQYHMGLMNSIRRIAVAFGLALALLVGQQAAALHDLGHATERLTHKQDSKPGTSTTCDQCFACAELSGAVGATLPQLPSTDATHAQCARPLERGAAVAPRLAFRSRAPPTLL
jgi:hypothetical protein